MNEAEFIRQQLRLEEGHLRALLQTYVSSERPAQALTLYVHWAGARLIERVLAHETALQGCPALDAALRAALAQALTSARRARCAQGAARAEQLLALLGAWSEPLQAAATGLLPTPHWRRVGQLSADSILEERQLYAAAHATLARS